jgi:hypothetical protein
MGLNAGCIIKTKLASETLSFQEGVSDLQKKQLFHILLDRERPKTRPEQLPTRIHQIQVYALLALAMLPLSSCEPVSFSNNGGWRAISSTKEPQTRVHFLL